ncbi:putative bacterial type II and III secretion system protein [Megalodesulfovibrio gigas DSM 1382 = ATCC 19364]|uniref:Putative bacterial type II and III secretion system protein n=2 Tax=Megalodesulfovibrio gigas TaxID=879 RepID=T2G7Z5_MEGG1|nr:putative bacterial type II and III secretion system protein [Megalodesulfovibrio gigas DSM 1382 = ATCC 19364]
MVLAAAMLLVIAAAAGCKTQEPQKDAFLEKWKAAAEQAQGHSPTYKAPKPTERRRPQPVVNREERPLPSRLVSLRMHEADLAAVLKALSRAGNQSVMLSPNIAGKVTVNIDKKPWDQVFRGIVTTNGLTYRWEGEIIRVMTLDDVKNDAEILQAISTAEKEKKLLHQIRSDMQTEVIPIRYNNKITMLGGTIARLVLKRECAKDEDEVKIELYSYEAKRGATDAEGKSSSQEQSSDLEGCFDGDVGVDSSTNAIIITTTPEKMERAFALIDKLDRPQKQIRIRANIVETSTTVARDLGMRYGFWMRNNRVDGYQDLYVVPGVQNGELEDDGTYTFTNPMGIGVAPTGYGMNFMEKTLTSGASMGMIFGVLGENFLEVQLNALAENNLVKILSSPSIVTMDNELGVLENGQQVPYPVSTGDQVNVEFKDALLQLAIRPHIIDDRYMRMDILVTQDSVNFSDTVFGYPSIDKRKSATSLVVQNKETVVISGLQLKREINNDYGLPGVKDVPVLGWLFKGESKSDDAAEILVFLTPTILAEWAPGEIQNTINEIDRKVQQSQESKE